MSNVLTSVNITLNGQPMEVPSKGNLLDYLKWKGIQVPALCYHPDLGAIETCDACIVEVNGELVRSCSTTLKDGDVVKTGGSEVFEAQMIAMDRVLENHELYCTVCDFNNGNCTIHNTVKELQIDHQATAQTPRGRLLTVVRSTVMIQTNVFCVVAVFKRVKTYK